MDKVDVRIIREVLQGDPKRTLFPSRPTIKPPFRRLSEELSLSEGALRDRFRKLSEFLRGWALMANPALFGERLGAFEFEVSDTASKRDVLDKVRLVEGVFVIVNYSSRHVALLAYYSDEASLRRKADLILRIASSREGFLTDVPLPDCDIRVSRLDLRIIRSLQANVRKANQDVASELGISGRTVKRRFTRLVNAGAVFPIFSLNVGALRGCVYCDLHVDYDGNLSRPKAEAEILHFLDDYLIFDAHFVDACVYNLILPNVPQARVAINRVTRTEGVKSAWINFVEERFESYELLGEKVESHLSRPVAPAP